MGMHSPWNPQYIVCVMKEWKSDEYDIKEYEGRIKNWVTEK